MRFPAHAKAPIHELAPIVSEAFGHGVAREHATSDHRLSPLGEREGADDLVFGGRGWGGWWLRRGRLGGGRGGDLDRWICGRFRRLGRRRAADEHEEEGALHEGWMYVYERPMSNGMETLRLDAGGPYQWSAGDVAIVTTTTVCERCDDVHLQISLFPDGDPEGAAYKKGGQIRLEPWEVQLDSVDAEMEPKLIALFDKHRDEVEQRGRRMLRARDRQLWRAEDLAGLKPGVLVNYRTVFPADFDLIFVVDDTAYWLEDFHCLIAGCDCANAAVSITQLDDEGEDHQELGSVTFDLSHVPVKLEGKKGSIALAKRLLDETDLHRRLMERRAECRLAAPAVTQAVGVGRRPEPAVRRAKAGRNDPCPCGSGKKYKKCCL